MLSSALFFADRCRYRSSMRIVGPALSMTLLMNASLSAKTLELPTADKALVVADLERSKAKNTRVALLFHQAGSNRHEYDPIAPALRKLGFDTLALDQRSGGRMWGQTNATVDKRGRSTSYLEALPDLEAAVAWAAAKGYKTILCVGSSYSAALNFLLAAKHKAVSAIASFSPGEYLPDKGMVGKAAAALKLPIYVSAGSSPREEQRLDLVLKRRKGNQGVTRHRAKHGVHGASTLRADRNPKGATENLKHFLDFAAGL